MTARKKTTSGTDTDARIFPADAVSNAAPQSADNYGALRQPYTGADTLSALPESVLVEIEEAIFCPPDGLLLLGWKLAAPDTRFYLRSGASTTRLEFTDGNRIPRQDVLDHLGAHADPSELMCGFMLFAEKAITLGEPCYLEVQVKGGHAGYKPIKLSRRRGLDAMRRALRQLNASASPKNSFFEHGLAQAFARLNPRARNVTVAPRELSYGQARGKSDVTIVLPASDDLDALEYQAAFLDQTLAGVAAELLYIGCQANWPQAEALFKSLREKFSLPFRVIRTGEMLGAAAEKNIAIDAAYTKYLCFADAGTFALAGKWLQPLIDRLKRDGNTVLVAPTLLSGDSSGQHLRFLSSGGGLGQSVLPAHCLAVNRSLLAGLGNFDEAYVSGAFDAADLLERAKAAGMRGGVEAASRVCVIDRATRGSPGAAAGLNEGLKLYDADLFGRRWGEQTKESSSARRPGGGRP